MIEAVTNAELPAALGTEALAHAGVNPEVLRAAHGWSNAVWLGSRHVVRVTTGRLTGSFAHEHRVADHLADHDIPVPTVIASGLVCDLPSGATRAGEWLVSRRVEAPTLTDAWPDLNSSERRRAGHTLGKLLESLHAVPTQPISPPVWWSAAVGHRQERHNAYHPPPALGPIMAVEAAELPGANRAVAEAARAFLSENADAFDDSDSNLGGCLVHTDCHGSNLLIGSPEALCLLDFEGARPGVPDLELDMLLRWCGTAHQLPAHPGMASPIAPTDAVELAFHVADAYPALFSHPHLATRLACYNVHWHLVQLHFRAWWRQRRPQDSPVSDPAWTDLADALDGRTHLREFDRLIGS